MFGTPSAFKKTGWRYLLDMAASKEKEFRLASIIRGYAWIEHALDAAGAEGPRRPIASRILRAIGDPRLGCRLNQEEVRIAINTRHKLSHEDYVPESTEATEAVKCFIGIWHALSRHFVNIRSAAEIGKTILTRPHIIAIGLYGSLARGSREPSDIDLFVLDDGYYANKLAPMPYWAGGFSMAKATKEALCLLNMDSQKLERCAHCRWLDIFLLDGIRFGNDKAYIRKIREAQPDRWFFVNISRDIMFLDPTSGEYLATRRSPFYELRQICLELSRIGFA